MKNKIKKILPIIYAAIEFVVICAGFLCLLVGSEARCSAYAAEEGKALSEEPSTSSITDEADDFKTVFKNDILPLIVGAGEGILGILIILFPYIKLRGKNKSLLGMLTANKETLKKYQELSEQFTVENFINAFKNDVIEGLQVFIKETVEKTVKDNFVDNTDGLNELKTTTDILSAQLTNFIKAASIVWREAPGATELLAKSPTSEVLKVLYGQVADLRKRVEAKQSTELAEVDGVAKELEVYHVDE